MMIMLNLDNMVKLQKIDDKSCDLYMANNQRICLNVRFEEIQEMLDSNQKFLFVENMKIATSDDELPPLPPPAPPPPKEIISDGPRGWRVPVFFLVSFIVVCVLTSLMFK